MIFELEPILSYEQNIIKRNVEYFAVNNAFKLFVFDRGPSEFLVMSSS